MARYVTVYKVQDEVILYIESTTNEDRPICEEYGDGYLDFWSRCRKEIMAYEEEHPEYKGEGYADLDNLYEGTTRRIWG